MLDINRGEWRGGGIEAFLLRLREDNGSEKSSVFGDCN